MKKIRQLFIVILFLIIALLVLTKASEANTSNTAESILLNQYKTCTLDYNNEEYYYKFIPSKTGYYEMELLNNQKADLTLYDSYKNYINSDYWDSLKCNTVICEELEANKTYYIRVDDIIWDENDFETATVVIRNHTHQYDEEYVNKAFIYGTNNYDSGSIIKYCTECDYRYEKIIPAVKNIKLSATKYVYDGKEKNQE